MGRLTELQAEIKKEQQDYIDALPFKVGDAVEFKEYAHSKWVKGRIATLQFMSTYQPGKADLCVCGIWPVGIRRSSYSTHMNQNKFEDIRLCEESIVDIKNIDHLSGLIAETDSEISNLQSLKAKLEGELWILRKDCIHKTKANSNICVTCKSAV